MGLGIHPNCITTVVKFNEQQEQNWQEYIAKCKANGVTPQRRNQFNCFIKFDYTQGFVADGKYPIYKKRKRDLL